MSDMRNIIYLQMALTGVEETLRMMLDMAYEQCPELDLEAFLRDYQRPETETNPEG